MATIKKNWLRAGISLFVLLLGVFYIVKAMEKNQEKTTIAVVNQAWHRVLNEDNEFEWRVGTPSSESCEPSDDICNVILPSGLNPAEMTTQQIKDSAVDGQYQTGYTLE